MITRFRDWSLPTERIKQWFKPKPNIGYMLFTSDLTCEGHQYTIGETYIHKGPLKVSESGFHYCVDPNRLVWYYDWRYFDSGRICEIEAGKSIHSKDKYVTNELTIKREISRKDMPKLCSEYYRKLSEDQKWDSPIDKIKRWFKPTIGYKLFNSDLTWSGYQYTMGKTHIHEGPLVLDSNGFTYHLDPAELVLQYNLISYNSWKICEIEAGKSIHAFDKSVTNKLTIVREIPRKDLPELCDKYSRTHE